jgi:hypothetical protein
MRVNARQCAVSYTHYPDDQHVPHVRLSGLWLEQLGFAIGTKLRTTASAGGGDGAAGVGGSGGAVVASSEKRS